MKKIRVLLLGMGLLSFVGARGEFLPVQGQPDIKPAIQVFEVPDRYVEIPKRLRLCSYNIEDFWEGSDTGPRTWEHAHQQARIAAAIIDEIDADVLILQEFENAKMVEILHEYIERPYAVGYITALGANTANPNRLNLAVLSRVPLQNPTELDFTLLEGPGRPTRGLLRFEIEVDDAPSLLIYNLHLKSNWGDAFRNHSQRHHAMRLLREDWTAWADEQSDPEAWEVILAGDFNVDPAHPSFADDPSLALLEDLVDLWAGRPLDERTTVPTRYGVARLEFPPVAFDRFYVTPGLLDGPWVVGTPEVLMVGVNIADNTATAGEDDYTASDHFPIFVDVHRTPKDAMR